MAAAAGPIPTRERKPSTSAPLHDMQGFVNRSLGSSKKHADHLAYRPVGPGFSRPKHKRTVTGLAHSEIKSVESAIPESQRQAWKKHTAKPFSTKDEFEKEAIRHIETTLARSLFNCDDQAAYGGTALAFRDRLIVNWNKTMQRQTTADQKRIYCKQATNDSKISWTNSIQTSHSSS